MSQRCWAQRRTASISSPSRRSCARHSISAHRLGELCRFVGHALNHAYRELDFVVYPHRGSAIDFVGMIEEPFITEQILRNWGLLPPVIRCPLWIESSLLGSAYITEA